MAVPRRRPMIQRPSADSATASKLNHFSQRRPASRSLPASRSRPRRHTPGHRHARSPNSALLRGLAFANSLATVIVPTSAGRLLRRLGRGGRGARGLLLVGVGAEDARELRPELALGEPLL